MTEETYNGWKNRATWNTHLWLTGNDYGTYQVVTCVARRGSEETAAAAVEALCREAWGDKTPDGDSLAKVDWDHIAKALRE